MTFPTDMLIARKRAASKIAMDTIRAFGERETTADSKRMLEEILASDIISEIVKRYNVIEPVSSRRNYVYLMDQRVIRETTEAAYNFIFEHLPYKTAYNKELGQLVKHKFVSAFDLMLERKLQYAVLNRKLRELNDPLPDAVVARISGYMLGQEVLPKIAGLFRQMNGASVETLEQAMIAAHDFMFKGMNQEGFHAANVWPDVFKALDVIRRENGENVLQRPGKIYFSLKRLEADPDVLDETDSEDEQERNTGNATANNTVPATMSADSNAQGGSGKITFSGSLDIPSWGVSSARIPEERRLANTVSGAEPEQHRSSRQRAIAAATENVD